MATTDPEPKDPERPADLTTRILIEIRDELRGHGAELRKHGERLEEHGQLLAAQGATLNQVLRAVEHGNEWRDDRAIDHESRITRLEVRLGIDPASTP